ncbi:IS110 family transposase [Sinorhizobium medicae]|nr:IS110 family transposase [Sinorhizobium medicae]MDX0751355.1 IS110 family transposase [Sinorhizobium medicae]MDX0899366.1 IS110 family transposase [Sinorhizobium medicae]MDX1118134.1 IS110 family transposase [Sinorhizobium medicae]MDX1242045.1 IS110 family transposase [Sinorhizobium medicae]
MEQFVGLDVSQDITHVCVIGSDGKIVWQGTCLSTPEGISAAIKAKAPNAIRIGLESGPLSTWHWHALKAEGLPIVCLDARHAKAALNMQMNKTDKNDAHGLAQIVKAGWYREVGVKSLDSHTVRSMLGARAQLVAMRVEVNNQIRGMLKTFGVVLRRRDGLWFETLVGEACAPDAGRVGQTVQALLTIYSGLKQQIHCLDRELARYARGSVICRRLMTIPGIGLLTAIAFITAIDDPVRFAKSSSVGAYLGLTPRRYQSGEADHNGKISKCGDPLVRAYLFEAATTLLTRVEKWSALKAWGLRIAKKSGMKKAAVAVARKMAVIMHRLWTTGGTFRWSSSAAIETA